MKQAMKKAKTGLVLPSEPAVRSLISEPAVRSLIEGLEKL
jgi:hypothetical protein